MLNAAGARISVATSRAYGRRSDFLTSLLIFQKEFH